MTTAEVPGHCQPPIDVENPSRFIIITIIVPFLFLYVRRRTNDGYQGQKGTYRLRCGVGTVV